MTGGIFLVSALVAVMLPAGVTQLSSLDKAFVTKAGQVNNYEIDAARLAEDRCTNAACLQYAAQVEEDQVEENGELESTVADQNTSMKLPTALSPTGEQLLQALKNADSNFDAVFRSQMISTHEAALNLYQNYIAQPDVNYIGEPNVNPEIQKLAKSMLPTFQEHLEEARNLPVP